MQKSIYLFYVLDSITFGFEKSKNGQKINEKKTKTY